METRREHARPALERWQTILLGSLFAMAGMAGYVVSIIRAGAEGSVLDGFANQSLLGSGSAAALLIGVLLWCSGNFCALQELAEGRGED